VNLSPKLLKQTDPYGGFLLWISFWRPNPADPDPEMPGLKQQMFSFLPVKPDQLCLCGSGQLYRDCCRPKRDWQPICHNPGMEGYSVLVPQEALFETVDAPTLKRRLDDDPRLAIVEDTPGGGFWSLWGDPALEDPQFGIIGFGDLELKADGSLLVTAMSDLRMQTLLDLLQEIAADCLNPPQIRKDPPPRLRKPPLKPARQKRRKSSRRN
jgi:hypothetical protein